VWLTDFAEPAATSLAHSRTEALPFAKAQASIGRSPAAPRLNARLFEARA